MKNFPNTKHLSETEITDLLRGPQKCIQEISGEIEVLERVALRKNLEKVLEMFKKQNDFENVDFFYSLLCNFDNTTFFLEFEDENSIVYSFRYITKFAHYTLKDSVFFSLPK